MTTTEICAAARVFAPRIQLRDVWFVLRQIQQRNLARCLNPRHVTGKLYVLTLRGRRVIHGALGLEVPAEAKGLDWRKYARVVRAKARSAVLLEVEVAESSGPATATQIRRSLRVKRPIGLNPVIRALKELEGLGLVKSAMEINGDTRPFYSLTRSGAAIVQQLRK